MAAKRTAEKNSEMMAAGPDVYRRWTAIERRTLLEEVRTRIAQFHSEEKIKLDLNLVGRQFYELRYELFTTEAKKQQAKTIEDIYLEYSWRQQQCVEELDKLITDMRYSKVPTPGAAVQAIKAKSDIMDKIIKTGQDMGILDKTPERKLVLHGMAVADVDTGSLRKMIATELSGLGELVSKYGNTDLLGERIVEAATDDSLAFKPSAVLDMPDFSADEKPGITKAAAAKAKTAKAQGARKAVKREKLLKTSALDDL